MISSVKTETWVLSLTGAPEIPFRDGESFAPSEVVVSLINDDAATNRYYMEFTSQDTKIKGLYSSNPSAKNWIHNLPSDLLATIFRACD